MKTLCLAAMQEPSAKLDKATNVAHHTGVTIADGFPGQMLHVLPRPRVEQALREPGTAHLVVTDCGHFPEAHAHARRRAVGIDQAIFIVCSAGRGWYEVQGVTHQVHAGQVLVVPPGRPHAYGANDEDPWTVWWLHVAGNDVAEFLRLMAVDEQPVRTLSDSFGAVALIEEIGELIGRQTSTANLLSASGAAWHLLAMLAADPRSRSSQAETIDHAREFLRQHVDSRVSVAELAAIASVSPSHFAFLFKQQVGIPVLQYQTNTRMARARELLDTTDEPIARISTLVGFSDAFYFSRQFKNTHGMTPMQYRKLAKG